MKRILTLTLAVLLVSASVSHAQAMSNKRSGRGLNFNRMENRLDLTEAQQEQFKTLKIEHMKAVKSLHQTMAEEELALQKLQTADKQDVKAIEKKIEAIGSIRTELAKKQDELRRSMRELLTEEQRVLFDSRAAKGHGGPGKGHRAMGPGRGGPQSMERGPGMAPDSEQSKRQF